MRKPIIQHEQLSPCWEKEISNKSSQVEGSRRQSSNTRTPWPKLQEERQLKQIRLDTAWNSLLNTLDPTQQGLKLEICFRF